MIFLKMFRRKWLIATLLVLTGTGVCIRLGIWQLDRLAGRREFNSQVNSMRALSPLDLNADQPEDIVKMEWRQVRAHGTYDFESQVALRNQYNGSSYGYHLLTPILLSDRKAVLVDRGWIPADGNPGPADWRKYDESGPVNVSGQIRLGQSKPAFGGVEDLPPSPGQNKLDLWNNPDLARIASQIPYKILPVYIQPDEDPSDLDPPIPFQPQVDLTEGPHFGYALQWFAFAAILFVGYPFYIKNQESKTK